MSVINTNVKSLVAQNSLTVISRALSKTMEQLSTGKRINSAADDAAGLADRLLPLEHALYPQAAAAVLSGLARLTPQGWQFDGPIGPGFEALHFSQRLLHRDLAGDLAHG